MPLPSLNDSSGLRAANEAEPASPCINVCTMDEQTGLCRGCLRTLAEIAGWRRFDPAEKQAVLDRLEPRRLHVEGANR